MQVRVELLTDDPDKQAICQLYWQTRPDGSFVYELADLAEKFSLSLSPPDSLPVLVTRWCHAFTSGPICPLCNYPGEYLLTRRSRHQQICQRCIEAGNRKEQLMAEAWQRGLYKRLSGLEFKYWVALAVTEDTEQANKKMGVSAAHGAQMFAALVAGNFLRYSEHCGGWGFHPEAQAALRQQGLQKTVKSVFGSPNARALFRQLSLAHLACTYPEVPICAFIDQETVAHLFTKPWHAHYFLTCRVDLLICDEEGTPLWAAEYQGGYHKEAEQAERDHFKHALLACAGVPVQYYYAADLRTTFPLVDLEDEEWWWVEE